MTESAGAARPRRASLRGTILGGAALITVLTVGARAAGFGRIWVFSHTVGLTSLADVYQSINTIPNILYEIVAGGVLASLVVPLLANAVAKGDREHVDATASGLLSWALLTLTPVAILVAVLAKPITQLMLGDDASAHSVAVGTSMLRVFAPQIVLYGIGVVLTGILQAHKRFGGPALAPLLSSLAVIVAYVTYAVVAPPNTDIDTVSDGQQLILSLGTTLGVAVLSFCLLVPVSTLGLHLRPRLSFPEGVGHQVRALAYAGAAALTAQQAAVLVALLLGNRASEATVISYTLAQTVYFLPWAILAVPVATSVYPRLAELWGSDRRERYTSTVASSTVVVVVLSLAASAAIAASARPLARIMAQGAPGIDSVDVVADGIVAFSFGLAGYSLFALLSRALYAAGRMASTAVSSVLGWLVVIVANVVLAAALPSEHRVVALAIGNSIGMVVLGLALIVATVRTAGRAALRDVPRVGIVAAAAAVAGGLLGHEVEAIIDSGGVVAALWQSLLAALVAVTVVALALGVLARRPLITSLKALSSKDFAGSGHG